MCVCGNCVYSFLVMCGVSDLVLNMNICSDGSWVVVKCGLSICW